MTEVTFDVTEIHAEMLEEVRDITGNGVADDSAEDFIHNIYKQAKRAEEQQQLPFEIEEPEERE